MEYIESHYLEEATQEKYYDTIKDFFENLIIRRALGLMWNEACYDNGNDPLDDTRDFSIHNPYHLSFLREILDPIEGHLGCSQLLENARQNLLFRGDTGARSMIDIKKYYREITAFILSLDWLEKNINTQQSMRSLLSKKVVKILNHEKSEPSMPQFFDQYNNGDDDENNEGYSETTMLQGFDLVSNLSVAGFSPVDDYGRVLYSMKKPLAIARFIQADIYYKEDGSPEESVVIDRKGNSYEGLEAHRKIMADTRRIIVYITDVIEILKEGNYDQTYIERLYGEFDFPKYILKIEDEEEQLQELLPEINYILSEHYTLIDTETQKFRDIHIGEIQSAKTGIHSQRPSKNPRPSSPPKLRVIQGEEY